LPDPHSSRARRLGLHPYATLVLFLFDVKSSLERKNPWGAIQAFQQAFPRDSQANVQLVIKALRPGSANQHWEKLHQQLAEDPNIKMIEADLKRVELRSLMGASDVFLSLHRSEGFGRSIAEAGILSLQVVSSAWGGNLDFCKGEHIHLMPCSAATIPPGAYDKAVGHIWGEPDTHVAAQKLRQAVEVKAHMRHNTSKLQELAIPATGNCYYIELRRILFKDRAQHPEDDRT